MAYTDIDDPSVYFQTTLYTGNGTAIGSGGNAITNSGNSSLQPDMVWIKNRVDTDSHSITDSVRGVTKYVLPDSNSQADSDANALAVFGSNGFTVGSNNTFNGDTHAFVSWNWKAGTSFSNSAGANGANLATTAGSVNTDAGFSILKWNSNSMAGEGLLAHGLGVVPSVIMIKSTSADDDWYVYHKDIGATKYVRLNQTASETTASWLENKTPTSALISLDNGFWGTSSIDYIAYCFAEKKGYSKFGSYTGNGNADGTFVYTGFKPAFVMIKATSTAKDWKIIDNKRNPSGLGGANPVRYRLAANTTATTSDDGDGQDFTSQGFKFKTTDSHMNGSGTTYIYMAFAENPFVTSTGVPATAR